VRYPFIKSGENYNTGEFVLRVHDGDWHQAAKYYRKWFMARWPLDKSDSWLRKKSAWFTSIIYQPEDRIVADYETYTKWTTDAQRYNVNAFELIGWDIGGLERAYPQYEPEPKLGGWDGFRQLVKDIHANNGRIMPFVNYNILDSNTELYKTRLKTWTHQDTFGTTPNWMAWGESTLMARKGLGVRRHLLSSVIEPLHDMLISHYVKLVEAGADGFQIDKICASNGLDFNPLNTRKPDEALSEGLVQAIAEVYRTCRKINPNFRLAGEATHDRMIPYIDVYYRAAAGFGIAPLRYAFPEWTACRHVGEARDFNGINAAVLNGAVICMEPQAYQASMAHPLFEDLSEYIKETERIRIELRDTIFDADFFDTLGAQVTELAGLSPDKATPQHSGTIHYRVHGNRATRQRAIVVVNSSAEQRFYKWKFTDRDAGNTADLYAPFQPVHKATNTDAVAIPAKRFQVLIAQHGGQSK
jgi:hypothetical protein